MYQFSLGGVFCTTAFCRTRRLKLVFFAIPKSQKSKKLIFFAYYQLGRMEARKKDDSAPLLSLPPEILTIIFNHLSTSDRLVLG